MIHRHVLGTLLTVVAFVLLIGHPVRGEGEPEWLDEFEDICLTVKTADSLDVPELTVLIERSDKLLATIEASDHPARKVYVFRLKKCRAFFEYIIALRQEGR